MNYRLALLTWLGLQLLLAANVVLVVVADGMLQVAVTLMVATVMAALVMLFFMRLYTSQAMVQVTAVAAYLWLSFLLVITLVEVATR